MNLNPLTAHRREQLFNYSVIDGTRNKDDGTTEEVVWIGYDTKGAWMSLQQAEAVADAIKYLCAKKTMRLARNAAPSMAGEATAPTAPTGRTQAQHPSRTAPLCKDCKHCARSMVRGDHYCDHPGLPVSLLNGQASQKVFEARRPLTAQQAAALSGPHCGPDGSLFEPAEGVDQVVLQASAQGQGSAGLQVPGH